MKPEPWPRTCALQVGDAVNLMFDEGADDDEGHCVHQEKPHQEEA